MVNDYYPHHNPARDSHKPYLIFDENPNNYILSRYSSPDPWVKIYFGSLYVVSKITFIPRLKHFLANNENLKFSIIKENGEEELCGILTGVNTDSTSTVDDQTYEIPCDYKAGVGIKVWKDGSVSATKISISYSNRE